MENYPEDRSPGTGEETDTRVHRLAIDERLELSLNGD